MQVLNKIYNLILCSPFSVIPKKNRRKATFQIFAQTVHETSLVPYREFYDKHIVKKEKMLGSPNSFRRYGTCNVRPFPQNCAIFAFLRVTETITIL